MKLVIVERTLQTPVSLAELVQSGAAGRPCLDAHHVRYIRSLVSLDGLRVLCEYEAPDAESVRQASLDHLTRKVSLLGRPVTER